MATVTEFIKLTRLKLPGSSNTSEGSRTIFSQISEETGAIIQWELGRGLPQKKDACIKLMGTENAVKSAKEMLLQRMETQCNRVVLKMDITHLEHPSLIGKGGKLIKKVMDATGCHIHFPDTNLCALNKKSNQVSITGPPMNAERARVMLRALIPIEIFFDVTLSSYFQQVLRILLPENKENVVGGFQVNIIPRRNDLYTVVLRCYQNEFPTKRQHILKLMELLCGKRGSELPFVNVMIDIEPHHQNFVKGEKARYVQEIMMKTGANVTFPAQNTTGAEKRSVKITGALDCVYMAWQEIMNCLPICIAFDVNETRELKGEYLDFLQDCNIRVLSQPKPNYHVKNVSVKGPEKFAKQMLQYRQHLLRLPTLNFPCDMDEANAALQYLATISVQSSLPTNIAQNYLLDRLLNNNSTLRMDQQLMQYAELNSLATCLSNMDIFKDGLLAVNHLHSSEAKEKDTCSAENSFHQLNFSSSPEFTQVISNAEMNDQFSRSIYVNNEASFGGNDYFRKKLLASKAMRRPILNEDLKQVPSNEWAGYGFSWSTPDAALTAALANIHPFDSSSQESNDSSGSSEDISIWDNVWSPQNFADGGIWSNRTGASFSHSNYFDFLRDKPSSSKGYSYSILADFLVKHGLQQYISTFQDNEIDYESFLELEDEDLKLLGIKFQARMKMVCLIREEANKRSKGFDAAPGAEGKLTNFSFFSDPATKS